MPIPGVNIRILRQEIAQQAKSKIAPKVEKAIIESFKDKKADLLLAFDEHNVTKELLEGPKIENSLFVDTEHGGNLYSLLGFQAGENPVNDLRKILEKTVTLEREVKIRQKDNVISIEKRVNSPTQDEVFNQTENLLPWTTRSWVDLVQKGITGLGSYLFDLVRFKKWSNSGTAIQAKKKDGTKIIVRPGKMDPIPYINKLLSDFRKSISDTRK